MRDLNQSARAAIAHQAAEWFVENRSKSSSQEHRAAFMEWLRASPLHVEEYLKLAGLAHHLHAAADAPEFELDKLLAEAAAQPLDNISFLPAHVDLSETRFYKRPERRQLWFAAAAAAVMLLTATVWVTRDGERFGLPKDFATAHGEQRSWRLPDGSAVNLNSDSRVTVSYDRHERVVKVRRGQALFQVAHEANRRFRVIAGDAQVIAVGTEFDVFRKASATIVTVVDGRVAVFSGIEPPPAALAIIPEDALRIGAGEQVSLNGKSEPPKVSVANLRETVAWVQRQIVFEERPLQEVAEEFNRYGPVPIEIDSDGLRNLPITGVFNAYDTESFIAFLKRLDGVSVSPSDGKIAVTRPATGDDLHNRSDN